MRISDWSSDVCSSDLAKGHWRAFREVGRGESRQKRLNPGSAGCCAADPAGATSAAPTRARAAQRRRIGIFDTGIEVTSKPPSRIRSEEHTSELQSLMRSSYAVFCLKQKTNTRQTWHNLPVRPP